MLAAIEAAMSLKVFVPPFKSFRYTYILQSLMPLSFANRSRNSQRSRGIAPSPQLTMFSLSISGRKSK